MTINEKTNTHLLFVLGSLFATNHYYNHDLVVTGASASSGRLSGGEFFFLLYLRYLLGYSLNQSQSEPLFVLRRSGFGTSLNPRNPLGYKISILLVMGVLIFLFCLNLVALISP